MNQVAAINVAETMEKLCDTRTRLAGLRSEQARLQAEARENRNWLNGHQGADGELAVLGVLEMVCERRAELVSLNEALLVINTKIQECKVDVDALDALRFSEEEQLDYAIAAHSERQAELDNHYAREAVLRQEMEATNRALGVARRDLMSAKAAKAGGMSLAGVAAASKKESDAQRRVSDAELLLANLSNALKQLPAELNATLAAVAAAESKVWGAYCDLTVRDIRSLPGYTEIIEALNQAFVGWSHSGKVQDFGRFLIAAITAGDGKSPSPESLAARKAEIASALKLAQRTYA